MPDVVLQARGLAKAFASPAGPLPVLTDVSLEVFAGESVSIRGSSGSGKTTLLQLLGGLDHRAGKGHGNGLAGLGAQHRRHLRPQQLARAGGGDEVGDAQEQ